MHRDQENMQNRIK